MFSLRAPRRSCGLTHFVAFVRIETLVNQSTCEPGGDAVWIRDWLPEIVGADEFLIRAAWRGETQWGG